MFAGNTQVSRHSLAQRGLFFRALMDRKAENAVLLHPFAVPAIGTLLFEHRPVDGEKPGDCGRDENCQANDETALSHGR
jgi:hypothetical protein